MSNGVGEFSVRWVHQQFAVQKTAGRVTIEGGQRPSLCIRGRKHAMCVVAGYPVRVLKRDVETYDKTRLVMVQEPGAVETGKGHLNQKVYSVDLALERLKQLASDHGITQGAAKLLERAEAWLKKPTAEEIDEDEFDNEEELGMSNEIEQKTDSTSVTTPAKPGKEKKVSAKKTKKAAKGNGSAKAAKGPSRISRAVEFMREEVKKAGGQKNLEHGFRKELFEKAAKKYDLATATCAIQYNKQVLNKQVLNK